MRASIFRYCLLGAAVALIGVAAYYAMRYIGVSIALRNSALEPFYQQSIRALWLGYCLQSLLLGMLFGIAALRPHAISRPVIVICGLLPMFEAVLLFSYTGSFVGMALLATAALLVLLAGALWPARLPAVVATTPASVPPAGA